MMLKQTVAPSVEPLSVANAKTHLHVTGTADDAYITALGKGARQWVENYCQRALITQTWRYSLDNFPSGVIRLPYPELQSITDIKYYDSDGVQQTWSNSLYESDSDSEPARVQPVYGQSYPSTRDRLAAVQVTYVAGYGDASTDVPEDIIEAIRLIVADWFENRQAEFVGTITAPKKEFAIKALLNPYVVRGALPLCV